MRPKRDRYGDGRARYSASTMSLDRQPTKEMRDFLYRRTRPFLDAIGMDRPITLLLQEAYLQGMADAVDVLTENKPQPLPTWTTP